MLGDGNGPHNPIPRETLPTPALEGTAPPKVEPRPSGISEDPRSPNIRPDMSSIPVITPIRTDIQPDRRTESRGGGTERIEEGPSESNLSSKLYRGGGKQRFGGLAADLKSPSSPTPSCRQAAGRLPQTAGRLPAAAPPSSTENSVELGRAYHLKH